MATFDQAGDAVRKIAGYLPYNPGPGIYSRLEKAIEQMPANVRVQELPGLLKRYKDGVPDPRHWCRSGCSDDVGR